MVDTTGAGPRAGRRRRAWLLAAVVAALAAALVVAVVLRSPGAPSGNGNAASPAASVVPGEATPTVTADLDAPPAVCGSAALDGPASPPDGAVVVRTGEDLSGATFHSPAGTTFWIEPGTHVLEGGEFAQVLPKKGNRYVGAPGAVLDGGGGHRYAFGGAATDVTIEHLTVRGFGKAGENNNEGVVNHDAAARWHISHVTVRENAGAGILLGDENVLEDSCLADNGQYGFSSYSPDGVTGLTLRGNEISGNNTDNWEDRIPGCGCTGGGKFWATRGATIEDNHIHDNHGPGLWGDTNNAGFTFSGNHVADNDGPGIMYETSYNAAITNNTFVGNGRVTWRNNPGFPTGAIYISESGSDPRVDADHGESFEIAGNLFVDNWGGVVAWENADRFAGSPANTSSGTTTLVNPKATTPACSTPELVRAEPYFSDCRWKTQRLRVHDNVFRFDPQALGADCTTENLCGYSGLFSNFGTYPDWSPYRGEVVEENITFHQDNLWSHNAYSGPWRFFVYEQGRDVGPGEWQGDPYGQDRDSTFTD